MRYLVDTNVLSEPTQPQPYYELPLAQILSDPKSAALSRAGRKELFPQEAIQYLLDRSTKPRRPLPQGLKDVFPDLDFVMPMTDVEFGIDCDEGVLVVGRVVCIPELRDFLDGCGLVGQWVTNGVFGLH